MMSSIFVGVHTFQHHTLDCLQQCNRKFHRSHSFSKYHSCSKVVVKRNSFRVQVLQNKNWETDGNLGKIFYTNYSTKYRFKNRELWGFLACRDFKRSVAKSYPINWTKYLVMKNKYKVAHLYDENPEETKKTLKNYNEFEK